VQPALADRVPQKAGSGAKLDTSPARLGLGLTPGPRGIGLVDVDGDADRAAQPFREPDVVGVPVGEDDSADVGEWSAEPPHFGEQVPPVPGQAGVDQGDAIVGVDQVGGDDVVADAVQMWTESHGLPPV
jgi:hypothetical protein